jgi:hypothetical protein
MKPFNIAIPGLGTLHFNSTFLIGVALMLHHPDHPAPRHRLHGQRAKGAGDHRADARCFWSASCRSSPARSIR